jgi:quercetin dioxygenase-like cupin family protein
MNSKTIAALLLAAAAVGSCGPRAAVPADNAADDSANSQANAAAPVVTRFDTTMTGQPLSVPLAPQQLVVTVATFAAGHLIPCHRHQWSRYVYLQAGAVRVTNYDAHTINDFTAGQILVEAIGQWHDARVTSDGPATLIVMDQVPPNGSNNTPWPGPDPSPCAAPTPAH